MPSSGVCDRRLAVYDRRMVIIENDETPSSLSQELGVDPKSIRAWLRKKYGRLEGETRWLLDPTRADAVRAHFRKIEI